MNLTYVQKGYERGSAIGISSASITTHGQIGAQVQAAHSQTLFLFATKAVVTATAITDIIEKNLIILVFPLKAIYHKIVLSLISMLFILKIYLFFKK